MSENIVTMPTPLDRLADQIRDDLERRHQGRAIWVAASVDLCRMQRFAEPDED